MTTGADLIRLRAVTGTVGGRVVVPGSKSVANRALVVAALAEGDSLLTNVPDGDDTVAMLSCLAGLGVAVHRDPESATVVVTGSGGRLHPGRDVIHAALAGTTSRFVTALAALAAGPVVVDGHGPLRERPMAPLHDSLVTLGATVEPLGAAGRLPVRLTGPLRNGGSVSLRGDVSSQFVSALMMIAPLLRGGLVIELTSPLVSLPYVELTASVMRAFGAGEVTIGRDAIGIPEGRYRAVDYAVEADASSASYPLAVAAAVGGTVTVDGVTLASSQGDAQFAVLLARMGCSVVHGPSSIGVRRDSTVPLRGLDVDMADISDLVPTVAAVAALASTPTVIRGVGFIRGKESDRLGDLAAELGRCGARVSVTTDGLCIEPAVLHGARVDTHHDHRLAMAFAVVGAAVDGIEVVDPGVVTKSWPGFWRAYESLVGPSR